MTIKECLTCAMDVGEQMMLCGAEVHRVEDSINRICLALGATRVDCFIIPSSMVTTVYAADGTTYTQTRRIEGGAIDFHRLDRLNSISRRICSKRRPTDEEILSELASIKAERNGYPFWLQCLAYAVIAGSFALFFGGSVPQMLVAFLVGGLTRPVVALADRLVENMIFSKFLATAFITVMSILSVWVGAVHQVDEIIIGNIMLLIPGLGFTNALRDLFIGDRMSGILRCMEVALAAVAIAVGYLLVIFMMGGLIR